ncbi:MAG: hypothetical protein KBC84_04735 [Proteobacteria bacterium]|nr:hypothetical protein [Pseudomonadota bacterium]
MRKKYIFALLILFCSGMALGSVLTTAYTSYEFLSFLQEGPKGVNKLVVRFFKSYYNLDSEQTQQMQEIVTKYQKMNRLKMKQRFPEDRIIRDAFRKDYRSILKTPEQIKLSEQTDKLFDEKFDNFSDLDEPQK